LEKFNESQIDVNSLLYATGQVALISVSNKNDEIIFANKTFLDIAGYEEKELIGQKHEAIKADEQDYNVFEHLYQTIREGKIWRGEIKNKAKDGSLYWVDISVVPVKNKEGITERYLWVGFFITSRKEYEEKQEQVIAELTEKKKELRKFELALYGTNDHVVMTDGEGKIMYANPAVENITGYKIEEILGKDFYSEELWGGLMSREFYDRLWKKIKGEKKSFSGTIQNKRKDGSKYYALSTISPILGKKGEVEFYVIIERDITEEKKIERSKTEFVSLASHQLRTPLSTINWYTEMLIAGDAGEINQDQRMYLGEIYAGSQRMVSLVDDLLDISRFELGKFTIKLKKVNITALIYGVLEGQKKMISDKKIQFLSTVGNNIPTIEIDENLLRMVLENLTSNAVKYTMVGGKIELDVFYDKEQDNVKFKISDNGLGIPKSEQKNIFKKMFRAYNVKEADTEGTGLGLYIAKSIVDRFSGEIKMESEENKGTTFSVSLPIKAKIKDLEEEI
jgi:PAS domain S-box-containing protein